MSLTGADFFTAIACPLCGSDDYLVVSASRYPEDFTAEQLQRAFHASSDEKLMDQLVRCRGCELIYVNPRISDDVLISSYESAVDPAFIGQNPERIRTFSRLLKKTLPRVGYRMTPGARLLDVGCAGGAFLVAARDHGFDVTGVEPSRWLMESGRTRYGLDIRQGILAPGLFPDESFDVITLWDVIEHVPQPRELLGTIHSLLKPGGLLLVNYPDIGSWMARLLRKSWPFLLSVHLLYYTRETMTRQLRNAGFTPVRIQPHFQSLKLGYILKRITPYFGLARPLRRIVESVGLGSLPFTYNMGQTLVAARKSMVARKSI
jgi:2-polyprenyl-3-methyl-5-hydroxy-6-metoxy-1,4-benzoquinol methylase